MFSPCIRKKASLDFYSLWMYLCHLFFILQEIQKLVSGSLPHTGFLLVWMYLATVVSSAPLLFPSGTVKNHFEMSPDGSYLFFYDTGPGQHQSFRQEKRNKGGTISGTYGYVDPLGVLHITDYVADRKGYRASLEIYEPIHQIPNGPALIVGPLPADLRSPEERASQRSVFDKYDFPIEPFESLKTESPSQIYSSVMTNIKTPTRATTFTTNSSTTTTRVGKSDDLKDLGNELESNETLPVTDINTLQKQLRSLSDLLKEDPLLLIGPLPGDLPTLLSLNYESDSLSETSRKFRSPFSLDSNQAGLFSNVTDENFDSLKLTEFDVVPSFNDLNFVDKDLTSNGEHDINSFITYPSSDLLQGGVLSLDDNDNDEDEDDDNDDDEENTSLSPKSITSDRNETAFDAETEPSFRGIKQPKTVKEIASARNIIASLRNIPNITSEEIKPLNEEVIKVNKHSGVHEDSLNIQSTVKGIVTNRGSNTLSLRGIIHTNPRDIEHNFSTVSTLFPDNKGNSSLGELILPNNSKFELPNERNFIFNDDENTSLQGKRNSNNNDFLRIYLYPDDTRYVSLQGTLNPSDQNSTDFTKEIAKFNNTKITSEETLVVSPDHINLFNNGRENLSFNDRNGNSLKPFSGRKTRRKKSNFRQKQITNVDLDNINNKYKIYDKKFGI